MEYHYLNNYNGGDVMAAKMTELAKDGWRLAKMGATETRVHVIMEKGSNDLLTEG